MSWSSIRRAQQLVQLTVQVATPASAQVPRGHACNAHNIVGCCRMAGYCDDMQCLQLQDPLRMQRLDIQKASKMQASHSHLAGRCRDGTLHIAGGARGTSLQTCVMRPRSHRAPMGRHRNTLRRLERSRECTHRAGRGARRRKGPTSAKLQTRRGW